MYVIRKQPQRIILKKSEASTQELRHLTVQVALRAVPETQDMLAYTYKAMNDVFEKDCISNETYNCINELIDSMQAVNRAVNGICINVREEYGIMTMPTKDPKGVQ